METEVSKEKVNLEYRAMQAWPVLTACAAQRKTIRYGELARHLGVHHRAIRYVLGVIQWYCMEVDLPPLTILVNNERGTPGSGFIAWPHDNIQTGLESVWGFDWDAVGNPFEYASDGETTLATLAKDLLENPAVKAQTYAKVKVRVGQAVFRQALLDAYEGQCAFCGLKIEEALEAAHIVPWAYASPVQRVDPRNGMLLCATCHKLFDHGYLGVSATGTVLSRVPDGAMAQSLQNKPVFFPKKSVCRPSPEALQQHREQHSL